MIKNFVKILELLGDRLEVCVSVFKCMNSIAWTIDFSILSYKHHPGSIGVKFENNFNAKLLENWPPRL